MVSREHRDSTPSRLLGERWLWAAMGIGLTLRVVGLLCNHYNDVDMQGLLGLASDLAAGAGLEARDLAYWPPLPSALAALPAALGVPVRAAGLGLVALCGTLTVLPAAWLAWEIGGARAARWAGWGAALAPQLVIASLRFHAEPVAGLFLLGAAVLALGSSTRRPLLAAVGAGALVAMAWLSRFELLLAGPVIITACGLWAPGTTRARLHRAGGAILGFLAVGAPYSLLLHRLGHGWGPIPTGRLNANLAFTLTGNSISYGTPGALQVATPTGGMHDADNPLAGALLHIDELAGQVLGKLISLEVWHSLLYTVSLTLLLLAGLALWRTLTAPGARRARTLLLLLAVPAAASLLLVDSEPRYWFSWALLALPLAGATAAWLEAERPDLLARWGPLLALGLAVLPANRLILLSMPIAGPLEHPVALIPAWLSEGVPPAVAMAASGGWIPSTTAAMILLLGLAGTAGVALRMGRTLTAPLLLAAAPVGLLQLHFVHHRHAMPGCHFLETIPLAGIAAGCRLTTTSALDAWVVGDADDIPGVRDDAVWIPAPRLGIGAAQASAYWELMAPDLLLVDSANRSAAPILELARSLDLAPRAASPEGDEAHLVVYAATEDGERCITRWRQLRRLPVHGSEQR